MRSQYILDFQKRKHQLDKRTVLRIKFYLRRMRHYDQLSREFHSVKRMAVYFDSMANGYFGKLVSVLNKAKKKGGA